MNSGYLNRRKLELATTPPKTTMQTKEWAMNGNYPSPNTSHLLVCIVGTEGHPAYNGDYTYEVGDTAWYSTSIPVPKELWVCLGKWNLETCKFEFANKCTRLFNNIQLEWTSIGD